MKFTNDDALGGAFDYGDGEVSITIRSGNIKGINPDDGKYYPQFNIKDVFIHETTHALDFDGEIGAISTTKFWREYGINYPATAYVNWHNRPLVYKSPRHFAESLAEAVRIQYNVNEKGAEKTMVDNPEGVNQRDYVPYVEVYNKNTGYKKMFDGAQELLDVETVEEFRDLLERWDK